MYCSMIELKDYSLKTRNIMKIIDTEPVLIKAWVDFVDIDEEAKKQIKNLASLPFIFKHLAIMPDVHAGKGATVGTVIPTIGKIIPAAIGVDIGCGMMAVKLPFKTQELVDLSKLRHSIERSIPVGQEYHKKSIEYLETINLKRTDLDKKAWLQFGTLGGGNHFIEISKDQNNDTWVIVHTGSRGVGHYLATKHINIAKQFMQIKGISLPDPDLAYFDEGTQEFEDYIKDLNWAQDYASYNRQAIMDLILKDISFHMYHEKKDLLKQSQLVINCHHNYSRIENHFGKDVWISRKGAVSARKGEYGIIPGSMGDKSFIVRGKGNTDSFFSCSHGAGRKMSRSQAKKIYNVNDLKDQTEGIECRKDQGVVDEIPAAYKNIDDVMRSQEDLVEVVYTLNQLICVKG